MITITCTKKYQKEREYICHVIFEEFLGLDYRLKYANRNDWCIESDGALLTFPDMFFQTPSEQWLRLESLPPQPLSVWNVRAAGIECEVIDDKIPVIYGELECNNQRATIKNQHLFIPLDFLGSAFFMLTRYEEAVKPDRDQHDRFPAIASLAYQEGFLDRPIINEYLEILWACIKQLWPELQRKKRTSRTLVSCDVDHPYRDGVKNFRKMIRQCGGDIFKRKSLALAFCGFANYFFAKKSDFRFDANFQTIRWMMDVNEEAGNRVTFFFKSGKTNTNYDADYSLSEPIVREIMRAIYDRGHEIGLHPSYETYLDAKQLTIELDNLRKHTDYIGIRQDVWGSRQHYLRWHTSATARNLENAGLSYDITLTYADHIGFRCGICYEFPMYDLQNREQINLIERPLVIMEVSVFGKDYLNLNISASTIGLMLQYKRRCFLFNGDFTLLWHNSGCQSKKERTCYQVLVNCDTYAV